MRVHHPIHEIDVVEVLLDNLIAADPDERVPIAVLPFHIPPLRIARIRVEHRPAQVIRIQRHDVADSAVMDLVDGLDVVALGVALRSGHHRQLLLFGFLGRGHEPPHAHRIGRDGFLGEYVLPGIDGRFEMLRTVARRRRQHHDIDIRLD